MSREQGLRVVRDGVPVLTCSVRVQDGSVQRQHLQNAYLPFQHTPNTSFSQVSSSGNPDLSAEKMASAGMPSLVATGVERARAGC